VPIVCADIPDLRGMAEGEGMAVRFHKRGDARDLAEQIITILQSPEMQMEMSEHNFASGVEMTMASVVKSYLRWFELQRCKAKIRNSGSSLGPRRSWPRLPWSVGRATGLNIPAAFLAEPVDGLKDGTLSSK